MTHALVPVALVVALAAALRSTWSPCGLSMLSSINPVGERARGHRFAPTATAFVIGAAIGGATLGAAMAVPAALVSLVGPGPGVTVGIAAVAAVATAAVDLGLAGIRIPVIRRQVDEQWLDRYRSWVYGAGFGWQIGVGFSTYMMTAAVALVAVLGALAGRPWLALLIGAAFGLLRGLTVLLGVAVHEPADLRRIHRALERWRNPVRLAVVGVQLAAAAALASVLWWPAGLLATGAVALAVIVAGPTRIARRAAATI